MGYYVTMYGELWLPFANKDEAYRRMCALNDHDELKRGSRSGGENDGNSPRPQGMDYHPGRWFVRTPDHDGR